MEFQLPLGISARHLHLNREAMDALFGKGSELHKVRPIKQPGQFASAEFVRVKTEKGEFKLRVLGPLRPYTQIEVSFTDARSLGVKPPIRKSGDLKGSVACTLIGPAGEYKIPEGIIVAGRHIHLTPATAAKYNLHENDIVELVTTGERALTLHNVLVRTSDKDFDEVHLDTDEANACDLPADAPMTVRTLK